MNALVDSPVVLVRWPGEADKVDQLRQQGVPRLLVLAEDEPAPEDGDPLQDWIRLPASDRDLHARIAALELRAGAAAGAPELAGDGRLSYQGNWVVVSPTAERMLSALVGRFREVVSAPELMDAGWPRGDATPGALRIHVLRIRQLIGELGLELKVVRDRGYVLQPHSGSAERGDT